jgi:hypothetical protein
MTVLSRADSTADIACTLPVVAAGDRLLALQAIIGDRLDRVDRTGDSLRVRIGRGGRADLDAEMIAWADAEKRCCAFLGFAVESEPASVTIEISAPAGSEPTLEGIEWLVRAAGRQGSTA